MPRLAVETLQPTLQWLTEALSTGIKRPKREANYSTSSSAEVPLSLCLHGVHRDNKLTCSNVTAE